MAHGFGENEVGARTVGRPAVGIVTPARHQAGGEWRTVVFRRPNDVPPGHLGHAEIGNDQIERAAVAETRKPVAAMAHLLHVMAIFSKKVCDDLSDRLVVIDDQDP